MVGQTPVAWGYDIQVSGSMAYVAAGTSGLQIVNVGNPSNPQVVKTVNTPGSAVAVDVAGNMAYVADSNSLQVINVGVPTSAYIVGSLATSASKVAEASGRVYALSGLDLKIISVSNPAAPVLLKITGNYSAQAVDAFGQQVFLAKPVIDHMESSEGVFILDVSNPTQPILQQEIVLPGASRSIRTDGVHVYAGDDAATLSVIDIGN